MGNWSAIGLERGVAEARTDTQDQSLLELYLIHRSALIDYATRITGSRSWAEDVVQDAYLRVVASGSRNATDEVGRHKREIVRPIAYLYRIVRNLSVDRMRCLSTESLDWQSSEAVDLAVAPLSSPEHELSYREQLRLAAKALAELPPRTQTAFEMHWLGGHTLHEIAAQLDVSVTLAHHLVRRAAAHCKARLDEPESE
jgi:RNA polymerase sigma factor (sigma-70 family)